MKDIFFTKIIIIFLAVDAAPMRKHVKKLRVTKYM